MFINNLVLMSMLCKGKICIEYSDVTNYNCNRRGLLTIKGNPAFRQVNKRGYLHLHLWFTRRPSHLTIIARGGGGGGGGGCVF